MGFGTPGKDSNPLAGSQVQARTLGLKQQRPQGPAFSFKVLTIA
jgi:hypothetical protein